MSNGPMDFESVGEVQSSGSAGSATTTSINGSKDVDGVPYCRIHHCRMKSRSGATKTKGKDYYSCPVDGCEERGIRIRSITNIVPPNPLPCPRCSTEKRPVYCERDQRRSTATGVVLVCPECQWNAGMFAVPQLEAMRLARRSDHIETGVGDR